MKKIKAKKLVSPNGEIHFVLEEHKTENCIDFVTLSEIEVKEAMKEEAAKPLLLLRGE